MNNKRADILVFISIIIFTFFIFNICIAQEKVVDALYKSGLKKYILGDYKSAISDFEGALRLDPDNIKVKNMYFTTLVKLGNIEYGKGNYKEARLYYEKALKVSGGDENIKNKLVELNKILSPKKVSKKNEEVGNITLAKKETESVISNTEISPKAEEEKQSGSLVEKPEGHKQSEETNSLAVESKGFQKAVTTGKAETIVQKVQLPFDIEKFIARQNEENRKMLDSIIKSQKEEREAFLNENRKMVDKIVESQEKERKSLVEHIKTLTNLQQQDRKFFSQSLLIIVGGGIITILIIVVVVFLFIRRIAKMARYKVNPEYSIGLTSENYIKEIPDMLDDSRLITDERYSDVVKAKKLKDLYLEFKSGNPSWDSIQEYITEVNSDIKDEILDIVEKKLNEGGGKNYDQAYQILMPLIIDGSPEIRDRSKRILAGLTNSKLSGYLESPDEEYSDNPLSLPSLMGMAKLADMKTGRPNHSVMVAEITRSITEALNERDINPDDAYKIGLAHDIGYMELPGSIFKASRNLTNEEFEIIKTHPVKGVNLLSNAVKLPQIYMDGIKYHHERMDGSGYPEGLEGNAIPFIARIVAVADFFIAVTSKRSYRSAISIKEGIKMLRSFSGKIFDNYIVEILVNIIEKQDVK